MVGQLVAQTGWLLLGVLVVGLLVTTVWPVGAAVGCCVGCCVVGVELGLLVGFEDGLTVGLLVVG